MPINTITQTIISQGFFDPSKTSALINAMATAKARFDGKQLTDNTANILKQINAKGFENQASNTTRSFSR